MEEKDNKQVPKNEKDNRSFSEKSEDLIEEVMGTAEDIMMGPKEDFQHDIPATMYDGNGRRRVNKIQTRKNLNKRIFGKKGLIILGIIIALGLIGCLVYFIIEKLLLA